MIELAWYNFSVKSTSSTLKPKTIDWFDIKFGQIQLITQPKSKTPLVYLSKFYETEFA